MNAIQGIRRSLGGLIAVAAVMINPLLGVAVAAALLVLWPRSIAQAHRALIAIIALSIVVTVVAVALEQSGISAFAATRAFILGAILFASFGLESRHTLWRRSRPVVAWLLANAGRYFVLMNWIAVGLLIVPFAAAAVLGSLFGEGSVALVSGHLPAVFGMRLNELLLLADTLLGVLFAYRLGINWGLSKAASLFLASAWAIAGGRLAPQTAAFIPTFLLPMILDRWRIVARRPLWLIFASTAFAFVCRPLWLPITIAVLADATASNERSRQLGWGVVLGALVVLFLPVTLLSGSPYLVGPSSDAILRLNGGDGAYPWEWLLPSPVTALTGEVALAWHRLVVHFGNAWTQSESAGWLVICLAFSSAFDILRTELHLRRFALVALLLSVFAALPSHADGTPLPDPTLLLSLTNPSAAGGAFMGLAGVLALVILAAFEIDALLARYDWKRVLVYPSALLLLIEAPVASGMFFKPAATQLGEQLSVARDRCAGRIGMAPGILGDEPIERTNRLIAADVFGSLDKAIARLESVPLGSKAAGLSTECYVADYDQQGRYVIAPAERAIVVPGEFISPLDKMASETDRYSLPHWEIFSLDAGIIVYRREDVRRVESRQAFNVALNNVTRPSR